MTPGGSWNRNLTGLRPWTKRVPEPNLMGLRTATNWAARPDPLSQAPQRARAAHQQTATSLEALMPTLLDQAFRDEL